MKHKHPFTRHYTTVHLRVEEREHIRAHIRSHIARTKLSVKSPFSVPFLSTFSRPVAAVLIVTLCGISTSGVTYAAQSALPDETLYPVKRFSERIESMLARTSHAQVKTAGAHALARIQEATHMHLEGRMTTEIEEELSDSIRGELLAISHVVARQEEDTPTARESAIVLGKVVGYTNVLNQTIQTEGDAIEAESVMQMKVAAVDPQTSPLVEQIEYFVDTHEDAIAGAVSNDNAIVAEHFISEIGSAFLQESPDPLVEATITAVVSSEHVSDIFPSEKGSRVLHALADMAEGTATAEALSAHTAQ